MPKKLEQKLREEHGDNDKAVYGTLTDIEKGQGKKMNGQPKVGQPLNAMPKRKVAKTGRIGRRGKL